MQRRDFYYHLPGELIAQHPLSRRSDSRLLAVDARRGTFTDATIKSLPDLLRAGDLMVFNDTRVIPARLYARKESGGTVEILIERLIDDRHAIVHIRAGKPPRYGARLDFDEDVQARVIDRRDDLYILVFEGEQTLHAVVERLGRVPLPPYIKRAPLEDDRERYQTVYARSAGAVAAPTAGLHFDAALMASLGGKGIETAFVTLHVGSGTFVPLRAERVEDHRMHPEVAVVTPQVCERVRAARAEGRRVIAVGTTSVRALEAASRNGGIEPFAGETRLFIYPGYEFVSVDAMITNFHLPESTLLILVCAFAGTDLIMAAYRHAVERRYRFLSYGDAMLVIPARATTNQRRVPGNHQ